MRLDLTALTTCFNVKSALSFCSTASGVTCSSIHQAAEVRSASSVGHFAGKSKRATLAISSPVCVATLRWGSLRRRFAAAWRTCSFSGSGMRDHSLVPRVLRQELPTAFLANTVASSLTFCGQAGLCSVGSCRSDGDCEALLQRCQKWCKERHFYLANSTGLT